MKDCLIIGGGPAGLAVANSLQNEGLDVLVVEEGAIAEHIAQYPHFMVFNSTRELLELGDFPLTITEEKPSRRQYLNYLARFVKDRGLAVRTRTRATDVEKLPDGTFAVMVVDHSGETETIQATHVVVACGAWDNPRKLNVPGEELSKVTSRFTEPHQYVGAKTLVVGGRSSAAETALVLYRAGVDVSLSYRRDEFDGKDIKYWLKPDLENRIKNDEIHGHLGTEVVRIDWKTVTLRRKSTGEEYEIANDFVLLQLGYDPPVGFLKGLGIEVDAESNVPRHDPETLETNVPGLFIAGAIVAGNVSGKVFIENLRYHGEMIKKRIVEKPLVEKP